MLYYYSHFGHILVTAELGISLIAFEDMEV